MWDMSTLLNTSRIPYISLPPPASACCHLLMCCTFPHNVSHFHDQVAEAEQTHVAAASAEHKARERLLEEQRRLSEAISINSALTQHLREVSGST